MQIMLLNFGTGCITTYNFCGFLFKRKVKHCQFSASIIVQKTKSRKTCAQTQCIAHAMLGSLSAKRYECRNLGYFSSFETKMARKCPFLPEVQLPKNMKQRLQSQAPKYLDFERLTRLGEVLTFPVFIHGKRNIQVESTTCSSTQN